ncbi:MAG: CpsD/CapB family tyrosine-protein kinase [Candidatus Omnitrophota bacterium]
MAKEKINLGSIIDFILRPPLPYVVKSTHGQWGIDPRIISFSDPKSYICEQYRKIIANLEFKATEKNLRTFLLTSAARFEGKSISSANLATLFSYYENKKVLLIDCDLRKPSQHRLFNLPRKPGVTNVFLDHTKADQVIHCIKDFPGLCVITSGKEVASPIDLFLSEAFKNFITEMRTRFDYIFIDTPPLLAVTDACILSKIIDGVIIAVSAEVTPEFALKEILALLGNVNANIVGMLLTHTRQTTRYYYNYKYYKYYKDYASDSSEDRDVNLQNQKEFLK